MSISMSPVFSLPISASVFPNSQPSRRHRSSAAAPPPQATKKNRENLKIERGAVTNQLSGLDVLWAMQRATDEKKSRIKRNRKLPESESESESLSYGGRREEEYGGDYSSTRALIIKDDWGSRLDDLEKILGDQMDKF